MKLIVDVGNTRITFALFDEGKLIRQMSVEEKEKYSTDYFVMFIKSSLRTTLLMPATYLVLFLMLLTS
ncbi:MAG: type III pantothenate kinase [Bacilli bacterium]|nr:type III pantothenate kinase [Bacilli bacterium]